MTGEMFLNQAEAIEGLFEILADTEPGGSVFWNFGWSPAVSGTTGRWFELESDDLSCTVHLYSEYCSAELVFPHLEDCVDGQVLKAVDRLRYPREMPIWECIAQRDLWAGPLGSPELEEFAHETFASELRPAYSEAAMRDIVILAVGAVFETAGRGDVRIVDDFENIHRVDPRMLLRASAYDGDDTTYLYTPANPKFGQQELRLDEEEFDAVIELVITIETRYDHLPAEERERALRLDAWMNWTDGTFELPVNLEYL